MSLKETLIPIQDEPEGSVMLGSEHPHVRAEELSLEAIGRFVAGSEDIRFEAEDRQQLYGWVEQVLVGQQYGQLVNRHGVCSRYIEKMTGLSRRR